MLVEHNNRRKNAENENAERCKGIQQQLNMINVVAVLALETRMDVNGWKFCVHQNQSLNSILRFLKEIRKIQIYFHSMWSTLDLSHKATISCKDNVLREECLFCLEAVLTLLTKIYIKCKSKCFYVKIRQNHITDITAHKAYTWYYTL